MTTPLLDRPDTRITVSPLVAAALVRVSRKRSKNADRERSPEQQLDAAREVTHIEGHPVLLTDDAVYEERQSASRFGTMPRRRFTALLEDLRAGRYGLVILWEVDRASRELESWARFLNICRERGVLVHVLTHRRTYDPRIGRDWKGLAEDGTDAAYFSEKLSVNVRRGHMDSADRGRPPGRAPRGYIRIYDPQSGQLAFDAETGLWQQIPDDFAPIVREIVERIAARTPIGTVQRDLAARGIDLHRNTVRQIALNCAYAALRPAPGGGYVQGRWQPIVPEATWRQAVAVIDGQRDGSVPGRVVWLLSNIGSCQCGASGSFKGRAMKDGRAAGYFCGICGTKVNAKSADEFITELAIARLSRPDAAAVLARDTSAEAEAARLEVKRLEDKLSRHRDKLEAATNADDEEEQEEQIRRLKPRIKAAKGRAEKLSTPDGLAGFADVLGQEVKVRERWAAAALPARKDVLRVLFSRVELGRAAHRGQPADERLTIVWKDELK